MPNAGAIFRLMTLAYSRRTLRPQDSGDPHEVGGERGASREEATFPELMKWVQQA